MSQLKELLARHQIVPKKSLGQHFVTDPNTIQRMVKFAGIAEGDVVVEVGAGCGALTLGLAKTGARVAALETDAKILPALQEVVDLAEPAVSQRISLFHMDALGLDWSEFIKKQGLGQVKLVANLPYNIAARLIIDVLQNVPEVLELSVMVQKEVAGRLTAQPGDKNFGIAALKVGYFATAEYGGSVSPQVFYPKPAVVSALIKFVRQAPAAAALPQEILGLAEQAFQKRRKMLRRSLAHVLVSKDFEKAGINPMARPQELGLGDWAQLADAVSQRSQPKSVKEAG